MLYMLDWKVKWIMLGRLSLDSRNKSYDLYFIYANFIYTPNCTHAVIQKSKKKELKSQIGINAK